MEPDYTIELQEIIKVKALISDVHPFLEHLFPIAIVENNQFFIYDLDPPRQQYTFVKKATLSIPVPQGVRAAFQLDHYDNQMACIVTGDIFNEVNGCVTIFHEFMHCQQAVNCEHKLKQKLTIARKAQVDHNYMWEITHPFPYTAADFVQLYRSFLTEQDLGEVETLRRQLKNILNLEDYEYMVWQEWKEGFARMIENRISQCLGLPENHYGKEQPYDRVAFYEGGAHYIRILTLHKPELLLDIENLFLRMLQ